VGFGAINGFGGTYAALWHLDDAIKRYVFVCYKLMHHHTTIKDIEKMKLKSEMKT